MPVDPRLILALDVPTLGEATRLVTRVEKDVGFFKIGLEAVCAGWGLGLATTLKNHGHKVFLDMKLHDIPETVARASRRVAELGVDFLSVHGYPQTMRAAVEATSCSGLKLLAITVLTSMNEDDLYAAGYFNRTPVSLVKQRIRQAIEAQVNGVVMSGQELNLPTVRAIAPDTLLKVVPGVRPPGGETGDQKRTATPRQAVVDGADFLVVGRPISQAPNPATAAREIVMQMQDVTP